jgi:hypothetical protein
MQKGGVIKKGRPISQEAAAKKVAKGKGMISYKYPSTDAQGTGDNKGSYSKLGKESSTFGGRKVKGNSRPVMQKGGSKTPPKTMDEAFAKRYPNYFGKDTAYDNAKKDVKSAVKGAKTGVKTVVKALPSYQAAKATDDFLEKRYPNYFGKGTMYSKVKKGIKSVFQNGGTVKPVVKKSVVKKPVPKKVVPASSGNMKTFRLMNGYDSKGGKVEKMQNGGSTRPVPGQKKPVTKELKITSAMTNGVKSPNIDYKIGSKWRKNLVKKPMKYDK